MNVGRYLRGEDRHVGTARTTKSKDVKVGKANAYLIAAAPELLEALETLLTHIGWGEPLSKSSVVYRRAQNAIAKAKGEV